MPKFNDLMGLTYGRLTVIGHAGKVKGHHYWLCKCTCGNQSTPTASNLLNGTTKSCGCLHRDEARKRKRNKHGQQSIRRHTSSFWD